ncbi:dTDP-4-dehydrorhamnose reductase [bacterium]|nr:dTDP-4-dehydrorhamnose reductase [bacterium]
MRILLTGSSGQLGMALRASLPIEINGNPVQLIATGRNVDSVIGLEPLDLADVSQCKEAIQKHQPDWVLNAGAYTAVDRAEAEPELAHAVNAGAPRALAEALAATSSQARFLQISTDFVFNGEQGFPYLPEQPLAPLGVYGASKASGEQAVLEVLSAGLHERASILRTSWVYGPVGSNFLLTMLRLHAQKAKADETLRVVADQVGCPTSTLGLAEACWAVIRHEASGVLHWSDAGAASWYDFAVAIGEIGQMCGVLDRAAEVQPIQTAEYPTPAKRPPYSLLECNSTRLKLKLPHRHWRSALKEVMRHVEK